MKEVMVWEIKISLVLLMEIGNKKLAGEVDKILF